MKKSLALLTASALSLSLVLAGCGGTNSGDAKEPGAADKGVVYLPVNTAVMDETGSLPVGASTDGVHPNIDYCRKWVAYLDENS